LPHVQLLAGELPREFPLFALRRAVSCRDSDPFLRLQMNAMRARIQVGWAVVRLMKGTGAPIGTSGSRVRTPCAGIARGTMISLKRYLEMTEAPAAAQAEPAAQARRGEAGTFPMAIAAYQSALREMGDCSVEACPAVGQGLKEGLAELEEGLARDTSAAALEATEAGAREQLQGWGRATAGHYRQKAAEVKALLLTMARMTESVGERDQRAAGQISEVTTRLEAIACLEDLTEIRASIERSAAELKTSVARMAAEGKQAIAELRAEVSSYQAKLEEAEELASRDALTGLHNRAWAEGQIERRMTLGGPLSVAVVDIDDFKRVNDRYGHLAGDELLKLFAEELKSASRSTDVIGRWGGDEFILVMDCRHAEADAQIERLRVWVCGDYQLKQSWGGMKLSVAASIGLAEFAAGETMKDLLARADASMYAQKAARKGLKGPRH